MMQMAGHALAIPRLPPEIPLKLLVSGQDTLVAPLTIALLEADVITTRMLRQPANSPLVDVFAGASASDLAMRGLSKWWTETIKRNSCKFFRWSLHVQSLDSMEIQPEHRGKAWFVFTRIDDHRDIPRFALERRIMQLERRVAGFGQTVLAVLLDATMRLPESFTPWRAVEFAEYIVWGHTSDDDELLEQYRSENGIDTLKEVIDGDFVLTRAKFFSEVPEWVTAPKRTVSRSEICAAPLNVHELRVVAACDAIAELVAREDFTLHPADKGCYRTGEDSVDGAMVLLWRDGDVLGRVTDDALNHMYESGNAVDFIDANPVDMTAAGIKEFQNLTEQMMQLAVLTERLILLIGDRL